jgi:parallel beta-helix repeat protein
MFSSLLNVIINDCLIQIGTSGARQKSEDEFKVDNNLIEGNTFEEIGGVLSTCSLDPDTPCDEDTDCSLIDKGICLEKIVDRGFAGIQTNFGSAGTIIRENILIGGWAVGISFGGIPNNTKMEGGIQGTCSRDSSRLCVTNADCNIARFGNKGTCSGAQPVFLDGRSMNILAERNIIHGSILAGIHLGQTDGSTVRGNIINGPSERGINMVNDAIVNAIIERNSIHGSKIGFGLTAGNATSFGARVRLNDITGYNAAVLTLDSYNLYSELSFNGKGNYWGLPCPGFDRNKVLKDDGQINSTVIDSHPYNQSVATTPIVLLPSPCENSHRPRRRPTRNSASEH